MLVKGTTMPTLPDSVVYTRLSEPPGISADLDRDTIVSPMCVTAIQSDFWVPVGSSVTSSLVLPGSRTMDRLPNLSATAVVLWSREQVVVTHRGVVSSANTTN